MVDLPERMAHPLKEVAEMDLATAVVQAVGVDQDLHMDRPVTKIFT